MPNNFVRCRCITLALWLSFFSPPLLALASDSDSSSSSDSGSAPVECPDIPEHRRVLNEGERYYDEHQHDTTPGRGSHGSDFHGYHDPFVGQYGTISGGSSGGSYGRYLQGWPEYLPDGDYVRTHGGYAKAIAITSSWVDAVGPNSGSAAYSWEACALLHASEGVRKYLASDGCFIVVSPDQLRSSLLRAKSLIAREPSASQKLDEQALKRHCAVAEENFKKALSIRTGLIDQGFGSGNQTAVTTDNVGEVRFATLDMTQIGTLEEIQGNTDVAWQWYKKALDYWVKQKEKSSTNIVSAKTFVEFCLEKGRCKDLAEAQPTLIKYAQESQDAEPFRLIISYHLSHGEKAAALEILDIFERDAVDSAGLNYRDVARLVSSMSKDQVDRLASCLSAHVTAGYDDREQSALLKALNDSDPLDEVSATLDQLERRSPLRPYGRGIWGVGNLHAFAPVLDEMENHGWVEQAELVYKAAAAHGKVTPALLLLKFYERHKLDEKADHTRQLVCDAVEKRPDVQTDDLECSVDYLTQALEGAKPGSSIYRNLLSYRERLKSQLMRRQCLNVSEKLDATGLHLESIGSYAMAEKMYREALDIKEKNLLAGDPFVADELCNVGRVLGQQKRTDKAIACYERALDIYRKHAPNADAELTSALTTYGEILEKVGKKKAAERLYNEARQVI